MKILKALSALLTYPSADLVQALPEIRSIVESTASIDNASKRAVDRLCDFLGDGDLYDRQEAYGLLFDRTRSLSLHLFEHVHGESRDRGQAMVDLIGVYEEAGYSPTTKELPDYLPLFLEFAATRAPADAHDLISQPAHIFTALAERLRKRASPYEAVFRALLAVTKAKPDAEALSALLQEDDPEPDDLEALDAAWAEEEVRFGFEGGDACGHDALAAKLRQARRPAPGIEPPADVRPQIIIQNSSTHSNNSTGAP